MITLVFKRYNRTSGKYIYVKKKEESYARTDDEYHKRYISLATYVLPVFVVLCLHNLYPRTLYKLMYESYVCQGLQN